MREHPILMSGPMVLATLEGRKTKTRRVIQPQPVVHVSKVTPNGSPRLEVEWKGRVWSSGGGRAVTLANLWEAWAAERCPYGVSALYQEPPDRLWVREAFNIYSYCPGEYGGVGEAGYPLRKLTPQPPDGSWVPNYAADGEDGPWRPSIHMPRWASRLTLELCSVRVERLQEMTEEDARAEGIPQTGAEAERLGLWDMSREPGYLWDNRTSVENFRRLWDELNAARGHPFEGGCFVWVLEFRRATP